MKKLFTLLSLISTLICANAQRSCDLRCSEYFPLFNQEIQSGKPFDITVKVKNLGPSVIKVTDTILYLIKIDANYLMSGGSPLGKGFFGQAIAVGDEVSVPLYAGLTLTHNFQGTHQFCTEMTLFNRSATDAATDPVLSNNTGCSSVLMNLHGVGLDPANITSLKINSISVSPNPAEENVTLNYIVSGVDQVKIVVKDLQGRELIHILNEPQTLGIYEKNVDVSSLSTGIYLVEYTVGNSVITSKLVKK